MLKKFREINSLVTSLVNTPVLNKDHMIFRE